MSRKKFSVAALLSFLILCLACSSEDDSTRSSSRNDLIAAIAEACSSTINYEDDQEDVYAYRADDIFNEATIQAGGHSTANQSTDLGVNIFGADPLFSLPETSVYTVSAGEVTPGTGYVFYFDGSGDEFISSNDNAGAVIRLESLTLSSTGVVERLKITFNNVEVVNTSDPEAKLCINGFVLEVDNNL